MTETELRQSDTGVGATAEPLRYCARPCTRCPWRVDTSPGEFSADRFRELANTTGSPGREVGPDAPLFACHKSPEGAEATCAGWLASVGWYHLGIRLKVAYGRLPATALEPGPGWPELHRSYDEMARAKARQDPHCVND